MAAPDETATEQLAEPAEIKPADLIGRTLGKFAIVEKLGRGGSGDVYRAEQVQLGRSVVVKVLRPEVAWTPNRVERFLREAKLASRLDHPYAAHIYAFGAEQDNTLWIAMEHVKGMTLDELVVKRGALPAGVFAPLFARLCEVVHTAHELGIIHRDIKGSNVMVIERAGQLLPKLLDFGIAKGEDGAPTPGVDDGRSLTIHGTTLGSPHYMSPEQWERPAEVDARADIYALGVLAYRCCCGWLPFQTSDRRKLVEAHLHKPPPPLPELVPPSIADAIYRALAKPPDARWQTAIEFAAAIREAANAAAPEIVPLFDPAVRDAWLRAGPQPIADAVAHLSSATTTVEADAAVRELVAITCRWLAVIGLSGVTQPGAADQALRERARGVVGRDDAAPWIELARAAIAASREPLPGLVAALAESGPLRALADRLDNRDRPRTAAHLADDTTAAADALRAIEPLLAYQLVLGLEGDIAESWQGARRRDRERVVVWNGIAPGQVALVDGNGHVAARLSPFAQVIAPLPSAEPELFLLWRSARGQARLVAAPWGFERDDDAAGQRLAALSTEDSDTQHDAADDRSPYPGLAAYGTDDADRFVGREREVEALANRLVRAPLIAVLGPSGVGKSSFLHAGLVPRLGEQHRVLTMRPGRHPMHVLAALQPVGGDSHDGRALADKLRQLGEGAPRGLVLVVDQLEELVTLCTDLEERRLFAETLASAADTPGAPVRVVASLRDDFATVIEGEAAFRGRFEVFVLATPPPEALRRIVIEPARRSAVSIDGRVVEDMVAEVAGRPASLPLLSFTASQLWATRDKPARAINHDAYLAIGGVAGALATYADEIYASLSRRDQDVVRDLFARLVAADGTRVPWPRRELEQLAGAPAVLAHLVDARLLVIRDDDGVDIVEIVHECLAERWPRLARWRSEDAADRALLGDVRAAARRWQEAGRRADLLWRGQALAELRRLAASSAALTALERAFADEAERAHLRARRLRRGIVAGVMAVLAAIAAVMAYLGAAANRSRDAAQEAASLAEQRLTETVIAQGRRELNDGRAIQALAYFGHAMSRGADGTGLRTMVSIASRAWKDTLVVERGVSQNAITASPNGWIAAGDVTGRVRWWSDSGALLGSVTLDLGRIATVRRLADDSVMVTCHDGVARIQTNRKIVARVALDPNTEPWMANPGPGIDEITVVDMHSIVIYGLDGKQRRSQSLGVSINAEPDFDADGKHALYSAKDGFEVVDLVTMQSKPIKVDRWGPMATSGDGRLFAYLDAGQRDIHLVDGSGTPIRTIRPTVRGGVLAISRIGDRIATISEREIEVFDPSGKSLETYPIDVDDQTVVLRDDDVWAAGHNGVLLHFHKGKLVASLPVELTDILVGVLSKDAIGVLAGDSTLAIVRASATQLVTDEMPCRSESYGGGGITLVYQCGSTLHIYLGRHLLGEIEEGANLYSAYEPASGRAALSTVHGTYVLDRDAKQIAHVQAHGPVAFEDATHLLVVNDTKLQRWSIADDKWSDVTTVRDVVAIAALAPGAFVTGSKTGELVFFAADRERQRAKLTGQVQHIVVSHDGRWLAVQLEQGTVAIVDARTGELARTLEGADNFGAATTFDATGDLVMRPSRDAMTIWDRATGENLVFGLDLLRYMQNARFLPDGRIETGGQTTALLDIPRDTRPTAEIVRDIACRVPLKVVQSRLEPATPDCKPP
jgi:tRNA A-37 threonylcarbamoyl transferase component Bud32